MIRTILFDVGDTVVHAAAPGTPVEALPVRPTPFAARTLAALARGFRLGAVTDTATMTGADVRAALAGHGIAEHLEVIVSSVDVGAAKPDPAAVRRALDLLGTEPHHAVLVGDADVDEGAARRAGIGFVRVDPAAGIGAALRPLLTRELGPFGAARALLGPVDAGAMAAARHRHAQLTKPAGSLGQLEDVGAQLSAVAGAVPPPMPAPAAVAVFAADHGVARAGTTSWPQEVTAQMVGNFVAGGAAINAFARQVGAQVVVVDVGVATPLPATAADGPHLFRRRVRPGTADLSQGPALDQADVFAALDVGAEVAVELHGRGVRCLVTGEMGIGSTTASAATIAALTRRPGRACTGRGTGIDDEVLARKVAIVDAAVARITQPADPISVLAEVGGLEIAALAGFIVGGASLGLPVVVDGVIADAGLLCAVGLAPACADHAIAGHRSAEPGATVALEHLGLQPLLDLDLRLGEGTGACLAIPLVQAAARVLSEMATFESADIG